MAGKMLMRKYINDNSDSAVVSSNSTPDALPAVTMTKQQITKRNRMQLFVLVRILFQYLEKVDPSTLLLELAKEILVDCERKHGTSEFKHGSLADAIEERLREAVGEDHWMQARKIQKQLMMNHQKKKMQAMKAKAA